MNESATRPATDIRRAYLYPWSKRVHQGPDNPYLGNFMDSLAGEIDFVNRPHPSGQGVFQLFKYINRIDLIFFNWIEDLPDRHGGKTQFGCLFFLLLYSRFKGLKIIWTLHNKLSHESRNLFIKRMIFRMMLYFSHLIITHTTEGVAFIKKSAPKAVDKTVYLPHPVVIRECPSRSEKKYDLFVWGAMHRYKGILEFVRFCSADPQARMLRVLIAGKFPSDAYYSQVSMYRSSTIEVLNGFIDRARIADYTALSRYTLFPYSGDCVLSSGALMDSVGMSANIIGPRKGAFADLSDLRIISIFDNLTDILDILRENKDRDRTRGQKLALFANDNTWAQFGKRIWCDLVRLC